MPAYPLEPEKDGNVYYLWSTVKSGQQQNAAIAKGGWLPSKVWVNSKNISTETTEVELKSGFNPVLLKYENTGRGWFVFKQTNEQSFNQTVPLSSHWYLNPEVLSFDSNPKINQQFGWYRFASPPGTKSVFIASKAKPEVWVAGKVCKVEESTLESGRVADPALTVWKAEPAEIEKPTSVVAVKLEQLPGLTGGAAIPEPVIFACEKGLIQLGNLFESESMKTYSGGMWYRKTISLTKEQAGSKNVVLDLGRVVASADVIVNGKPVGIKAMSPWEFDLTGKLKSGQNQIEILIYNTLGNHFLTTPSQYVGRTDSGLMGPVKLVITEQR
jgi:hypothetical protein